MKKELANPLAQLQETARRIAELQAECKLPVTPDEIVESFKPALMDVIHSWSLVRLPCRHPQPVAKWREAVPCWSALAAQHVLPVEQGKSFADVCLLSDLFEGSIIRATRRLDELMNQLQASLCIRPHHTLIALFSCALHVAAVRFVTMSVIRPGGGQGGGI